MTLRARLAGPPDLASRKSTMKIENLTPHPVTIIRQRPSADGNTLVEHRVEFGACEPHRIARATECPTQTTTLLSDDDGQGTYANLQSWDASDLIEIIGYQGTNLPEIPPGQVAFGVEQFYIVSVVVAIAALASGRPICDLLIPMGQVRDSAGRIVGATSLAPAEAILAPMAVTLAARWRSR